MVIVAGLQASLADEDKKGLKTLRRAMRYSPGESLVSHWKLFVQARGWELLVLDCSAHFCSAYFFFFYLCFAYNSDGVCFLDLVL